MRLAYLENPETWKKAAEVLDKLAKEVQVLFEKSNTRFSRKKLPIVLSHFPRVVMYHKPIKKEITLQTIIEDIDEIIHVGKLIINLMENLKEIFSPSPTYKDFLDLLSQNSDFDINARTYSSHDLLLSVLHDILKRGLEYLPEVVTEDGILSRGSAPYLTIFLFCKGTFDSFLLQINAGITYLKNLKMSIRARCRAHLSRQLEPVQITRVLGAKLADMILKKPWNGLGRSPPDFFWYTGQDPGLTWAKRGLTQERDT